MKILSARAQRGKLKYYDEHIDFTLDDTPDYDWRKINNQIKLGERLSIPKELKFTPSKAKFQDLDKYDWLKTSFALPILNNKFIGILKENITQKYEVFPVIIENSKGERNLNFSAIYLKEYLDCMDKENSQLTKTPNHEYFEFKNCVFKENIEYPLFFKIKDISTPFKHFTTENGLKILHSKGIKGIDTFDK